MRSKSQPPTFRDAPVAPSPFGESATFGEALPMDGVAPALFGCRRPVAGGQFQSGLSPEMHAGFLLLLRGHWRIPATGQVTSAAI